MDPLISGGTMFVGSSFLLSSSVDLLSAFACSIESCAFVETWMDLWEPEIEDYQLESSRSCLDV
jgi:hypothetical protein